MSTTLTPSEYYLVPRRDLGGENSPPNTVRRVIKQLRRGAGDRSARVLILLVVVVKGAKNLACFAR